MPYPVTSDTLDARSLVLKCGIRPDLSGCTYLVKAIELRSEGLISFSEIYGEIASMYSVHPKTVSRDISYAVSQAYDIKTKLGEMLGIPVSTDKLRNGLVISYLSYILDNGIETPLVEASKA